MMKKRVSCAMFCLKSYESSKEPRDWIRKKIEPSWEISDSFISKYISMKREEIREGNKKEDGGDLLTFYINEDD